MFRPPENYLENRPFPIFHLRTRTRSGSFPQAIRIYRTQVQRHPPRPRAILLPLSKRGGNVFQKKRHREIGGKKMPEINSKKVPEINSKKCRRTFENATEILQNGTLGDGLDGPETIVDSPATETIGDALLNCQTSIPKETQKSRTKKVPRPSKMLPGSCKRNQFA